MSFENLLNHPLAIANIVITAGIFIHGVCTINHMDKQTPLVYVIGFALLTVGAFAVVIGVPYGYVSNEPQEVCMNLGLLIVLLFAAVNKKKAIDFL